jgi:DNA invertase Pin-like site-specific DNA recombinase
MTVPSETTAVSYLRVSSLSQSGNDGFPRQREAIERYAAAQGITLVDEFSDDGISGTTELENRPGLAACLERIENNGVKMIIIEDATRLARDAMVSELIVRQFQKIGGIIVTAAGLNLTEGGDQSPTAAFIRGIFALMSEWERRVIVLKLRAARDRKKAKTGRCEGVAPFGSRPGEAEALRLMLQWQADGIASDTMAVNLQLRDIPTRSGTPWRGSVIRKILKRKNVPQKAS